MCRGVIERSRDTQLAIYFGAHGVTDGDHASRDKPKMRMRFASLASVAHHELSVCAREDARVSHLATRFRVERTSIENNLALFAFTQPHDLRTVFDELQ